jgi:phosphopantothenoylcysteine decarboxylase
MTHAAQQFITPLTFQTLSRNPVITNVFDSQGWKPGHVDLADRADLLLVAPATANIIAELAHGLAANPITEIALATLARVLIAPAMNGKMWLHAATQANVETLRTRGVEFIGPEDGQLACGYQGIGRLWPVEGIVEKAMRTLGGDARDRCTAFAA